MKKPSVFNIVKNSNGKFVVLNTISRGLCEIDERISRALADGNIDVLTSDEVNALYEQGFIVDEQLDEIAVLRRQYSLSKESTDVLDLVIAPTLMCNFACEYCYEHPVDSWMDEFTAAKLLQLVGDELKHKTFRRIKVSWYGGEPLLALKTVEELARRLIEIAEDNGVSIDQGIVTNGYFLTPDTVRRLIDAGISHAQVTVDGSKETHDSRRYLSGGGPTYAVIIANLRAIADTVDRGTFTVSVRCNVDRSNYGGYDSVKHIIDSLGSPDINCYPAIVEIVQEHIDSAGNCMNDEEYGDFYFRRYESMELGQALDELLEPKACYCSAERTSAYIIGPDGDVFCCWNDICTPELRLFNINDPDQLEPIAAGLYRGRDPFTEEKCVECPYLPICVGGCSYEKRITGDNRCVPARRCVERLLERYVTNER